ncbi:hypothetical protein QQ045_005491 [Rhodiola kirilowii]
MSPLLAPCRRTLLHPPPAAHLSKRKSWSSFRKICVTIRMISRWRKEQRRSVHCICNLVAAFCKAWRRASVSPCTRSGGDVDVPAKVNDLLLALTANWYSFENRPLLCKYLLCQIDYSEFVEEQISGKLVLTLEEEDWEKSDREFSKVLILKLISDKKYTFNGVLAFLKKAWILKGRVVFGEAKRNELA